MHLVVKHIVCVNEIFKNYGKYRFTVNLINAGDIEFTFKTESEAIESRNYLLSLLGEVVKVARVEDD